MADIKKLEDLARLVRYYILRMTTKAGSGHTTSALSAVEIMVSLFFTKLRFDIQNPKNPANDRVIFSKGHASPLLYALWAAARVLAEKALDDYRKFKSPLEGHPTPRFKYVDVATGSLGQGLSIGLGMAMAMRSGAEVGLSARAFSNASVLRSSSGRTSDTLALRLAQGSFSENVTREQPSPRLKVRVAPNTLNTLPRVYVLMGDSETAEGSVWEAMELASYYKVGNLVGIIDVNRLGQSGETMLGWNIERYRRRIEAFGWQAHLVNGHDMKALVSLFEELPISGDRPQMIIAKTVKGKGVSFLEDKEGWHGVALKQGAFEKAIKELGKIDFKLRGEIAKPVLSIKYQVSSKQNTKYKIQDTKYKIGEMLPTRKAYGEALAKLGEFDERIVCLDAEVKNSTFALTFKEKFPERYIEMFIAEQNMVGVALGLSKLGKIPFVSTFAVFYTRAFDQIRMSAYSRANIKFVGSHAGVSIGEDGPSQMGLEDIALFRAIAGSVVLCPADAVACHQLTRLMAENEGIFYMRTAKPPTPVIYQPKEGFKVGGSKILRLSTGDKLTIVACGVVVIEALKAADELAKKGIKVRVVDAYSIKPTDEKMLISCARDTNNTVVTVEDHYFEGGLGDAVLNVFAQDAKVKVYKLAVAKIPRSGKSEELLDYEGISQKAIIKSIYEALG